MRIALPARNAWTTGWLRAFALLVLAALAIAGTSILVRLLTTRSPSVEASGSIEVTQSDVAPKVAGRLMALRVRDGAYVRKGQVLAVLERLDPSRNVDQARAALAAAQAQLAIAQGAAGQAGELLGIERRSAPLGVNQARAQLSSATSSYERTQVELGRMQRLVSTGDVPQARLDDATVAFRSAQAQLSNAQDAVALALAAEQNVTVRAYAAASSNGQVEAAHAAVAQARATLAHALDQLREADLIAPYDGYVISHNFEAGELIGAGAPVVTVGDLTHPYAYVFVSETQVPNVRSGMRATAVIDGLPNQTFDGTITEVGSTAEFTPENVQTKAQRIEYLVFRVKIQFNDPAGKLRPGLPIDATIPL